MIEPPNCGMDGVDAPKLVAAGAPKVGGADAAGAAVVAPKPKLGAGVLVGAAAPNVGSPPGCTVPGLSALLGAKLRPAPVAGAVVDDAAEAVAPNPNDGVALLVAAPKLGAEKPPVVEGVLAPPKVEIALPNVGMLTGAGVGAEVTAGVDVVVVAPNPKLGVAVATAGSGAAADVFLSSTFELPPMLKPPLPLENEKLEEVADEEAEAEAPKPKLGVLLLEVDAPKEVDREEEEEEDLDAAKPNDGSAVIAEVVTEEEDAAADDEDALDAREANGLPISAFTGAVIDVDVDVGAPKAANGFEIALAEDVLAGVPNEPNPPNGDADGLEAPSASSPFFALPPAAAAAAMSSSQLV